MSLHSNNIFQPRSTEGPKLKAVAPSLSSFPHDISVHEDYSLHKLSYPQTYSLLGKGRELDVLLKYLLSSASRCATAKREDGNLNLLQVPLTQSVIQGKFRFAVISSLGLSPSHYRQLWRAFLTRGGYQLRHWVPWY
jgi:hypothetical protein